MNNSNRYNRYPHLTRIRHAAILVGLGIAAMQTASAADLFVCAQTCTYPTIQGAIDNAHSGDAIHIAAGTYFENLAITGTNLTLIGAGEDLTIIDGRFRKPVLTLGQPGANSIAVRIFAVTITHGSGTNGGGIAALGASLDLEGSLVTSNRATMSGGEIGRASCRERV